MLYYFFTVDTWTVAFSPDSRYIATGSHAGKINLIGVESGKKESALDTRGKFTMSIAYVCYYRFFFDVMTCSMQSQICSLYMLASKTAQTVEQMSVPQQYSNMLRRPATQIRTSGKLILENEKRFQESKGIKTKYWYPEVYKQMFENLFSCLLPGYIETC